MPWQMSAPCLHVPIEWNEWESFVVAERAHVLSLARAWVDLGFSQTEGEQRTHSI